MNSKPKPKRKVGRPTKATGKRLSAILEDIARGLTEEQACAVNGCTDRVWRKWKSHDVISSAALARAKGMFIKTRLDLKDACSGPEGGDWKRYVWELQCAPGLREQFRKPDGETNINLTQNNNTLNVMDATALENARRALEEVKAIKDARRTREEARQPSIEAETTDADFVAEERPQAEPEPEPSPQSPTPREPVERWCDKHPIEPSLRQKLLAQARRMGRNDGDGKGIF
jgi:hypothetical protein